MTIGEAVKAKRLERGMSQEELAKLVGYQSRSSINKIELDLRDPPHSMIIAISKALDVSPNYLMGWENTEAERQSPTLSRERLFELNEDEEHLIKMFRRLTKKEQGNIIGRVELLTEQHEEAYQEENA